MLHYVLFRQPSSAHRIVSGCVDDGFLCCDLKLYFPLECHVNYMCYCQGLTLNPGVLDLFFSSM